MVRKTDHNSRIAVAKAGSHADGPSPLDGLLERLSRLARDGRVRAWARGLLRGERAAVRPARRRHGEK